MWRFVSGTQRGASFNWHTNCCNTRTHTRHTMFPDRRHRKRAASNIHAVTWKYRKSTFAHADGHLLEWSSSESFITNTHAIYWCMQMWENMRHTHTNTSMQTHSDLYTRWRLARSTTADFILNVTPPSWLELTIIFGLNEFVVLLICRFPTRSLKTHRASN